MEMSSPLAAMHPPALPGPWGYRRDLPTSKPLFAAHSMGSQSFNFRDMSMGKGGMDYFNIQPTQDSSPTSSLAADMSSNLHVDQRYAAPALAYHPFIVPLLTSFVQPQACDTPPLALHIEPVSTDRLKHTQ
jgi:hypothetical protein